MEESEIEDVRERFVHITANGRLRVCLSVCVCYVNAYVYVCAWRHLSVSITLLARALVLCSDVRNFLSAALRVPESHEQLFNFIDTAFQHSEVGY